MWDTRPFPSCTAIWKRDLGKSWPDENREKGQSAQSLHPPLDYEREKGVEEGKPLTYKF